MGKLFKFFDGFISALEMLIVLGFSMVFVWDSIWQGNQVALEIAMIGFFIYCAVWRLRFK